MEYLGQSKTTAPTAREDGTNSHDVEMALEQLRQAAYYNGVLDAARIAREESWKVAEIVALVDNAGRMIQVGERIALLIEGRLKK